MSAHRRTRRRTTKKYARTKAKKGLLVRRSTLIVMALILIAALLGALGWGLYYAGTLFFSRNPNFTIRQIEMSSDGRLSGMALREFAGTGEGENLFAVDLDELRARLEAVPLIETVTIRRRLPDTLVVRVIERIAIAQLRWSRRVMPLLIDRYGVILPATRSGGALPVINGYNAQKLRPGARINDSGVLSALALLAEVETLQLGAQLHFESFDLRYPDFVNARINTGISARFPRYAGEKKLRRLASVLQLAREQGRRVKTVDLTPDGRNVPVTFY